MKKHFQYLWYVIRHKWFVLVECCKLGIPWRGIVHDLSKFSRAEWGPYVRLFYGHYLKASEIWKRLPGYSGPTKEDVERDFDLAWLRHLKRNPHHWQYWILVQDSDDDKILPMPDKYRREMLADWRSGDHIPEMIPAKDWYIKSKDKMQLHPATRQWLEEQLK